MCVCASQRAAAAAALTHWSVVRTPSIPLGSFVPGLALTNGQQQQQQRFQNLAVLDNSGN